MQTNPTVMTKITRLLSKHSDHLSQKSYMRLIKEIQQELDVATKDRKTSSWSIIEQHDDSYLISLLEEAIRPSLTCAFSNNNALRDIEITLQTIILLRALTKNNSLFSQYIYELEASLFTILKTSCPCQNSEVLKYDIKSYEGRIELRKAIKEGAPVIIQNLQFRAREWNVEDLIKAYGEKEVLLTRDGEQHEWHPLSQVRKKGFYLANSGQFTENVPELISKLSPFFCKKLLSKSLGAQAIISSYQLFISDSAGTGTPCHNDLSGESNLFFQIQGKKKWRLIDPVYSLLVYPVMPDKPTYGESLIIKTDGSMDKRARLAEYIPQKEVIIKAGDVLYVPPFYWHSVQNLTDRTFAIATRWTTGFKDKFKWLATLSNSQIKVNQQEIDMVKPKDAEANIIEMMKMFEELSHQKTSTDQSDNDLWSYWISS